jgi:signal transduction histidine kinase
VRFARHQSAFVGASVLTVGSFLGATAYSQERLTALDALSSTIATNAVPSIEFLGRGGVRLQRLRRLVHDEVTSAHSRSAIETAAAELEALDGDIDRYLRLTPLPGERDLWLAIRRDIDQATDVVRAILDALEHGDQAAATALLETKADPAFEGATKTMLAAMEFDVDKSERLAQDVGAVRRATAKNIIMLDALATAIAAFTALIAFRAAQEHDRLLQRHNALLTDRVAELDRFAGRAAHDILSPLNTIGVGLALIARTADASARTYIGRSQRALQRVQQLVDGLLQFARSGAQSESTVRCSVDVVLEAVAADVSEAAKTSAIEIAVDADKRLEVACSIGVLTSMVQNLVSNAVKYMGPATVRKVTLRAKGAARQVRIEVEDTGPGIPADFQARIFDPFVRGSHDDRISGLGLGLATVKRLVEAHGGTIVHASTGSGTLFRIELPRPPDDMRSPG